MAWLMKKQTTVYVSSDGNRVAKGTPGAVKQQIGSLKWYGCWKEGTRKVMVPLATDKQASQAMLTDMIRRRERGEAGMANPFKQHLNRPIEQHMDEYVASLREEGKTLFYIGEKERILKTIFNRTRMKTLADLTPERLDKYLAQMVKSRGLDSGQAVAPATKVVHRSAAISFANWLKEKKRLADNPLENVTKPKGKTVRDRRSLTRDEIQILLTAARERPLREASTNTGGRKSKRKTKRIKRVWAVSLRSESELRYKELGRERALLYKMALMTGLRRGELTALRVAFLRLDLKPLPSLELPGEFTKNGEKAKLLLVPELAEELRQWITDTNRQTNDLLFTVSSKINNIFKRDLKAAGIPYQDDRGRFADFHSLRHAANTMLGIAGIPPKLRQLFMRHSDIRLTTATYDDDSLYEMQPVIAALEALNLS